MAVAATLPTYGIAPGAFSLPRRTSAHASTSSPRGFDVIAAYQRALEDQEVDDNPTLLLSFPCSDASGVFQAPHPIAAILSLVELMETSTASTVTGLATELTLARQLLVDTQPSLGVRAGCQLWERFFALSGGGQVDSSPFLLPYDKERFEAEEPELMGRQEFPAYKRSLISQGRSFCAITAPQCREKIAALAVDFLRDDCTVLTHDYSRTVVQTILRAHEQHKRVKVYVTEARPSCMGLRTHQILTAAGIPCTVVLDSAVAYVMERVDMVLVGSEAVVESGGLVSSIGTYQVALVAKAMQKPFYALAESYKFLRHFPLSQTDLPIPRLASSGSSDPPLSFLSTMPPQSGKAGALTGPGAVQDLFNQPAPSPGGMEMTKEMEDLNPMVDVTTPDLIDFIMTDLGAPLSPTSVSQYLVAQFSS